MRKNRRDAILFVAGLLGVIYEATRQGAERPLQLAMYASMIGLPVVFRRDERR